ncbi:hypothetical protein C8F04DRAFT_1280653 [Mycena alexandri]|uniref:Uncharacterized protein n=1 Tax=Mycena alexandri TaxID=1745969 RepID=A0AAD6RWR9_9AGAR|nr:hypothetical protein C8F04DRAFT_1280653 [Mycena alexandri]
MPAVNSLLKVISTFRLGYNPQNPYPWRWTTPIVLCTFMILSALLAVINSKSTPVPLDQNSIILHVGDTVRLNDSDFKFTIIEAFDAVNRSLPVPSFSYYNNPFSDGCDITQMSVTLLWKIAENSTSTSPVTMTGVVTCRIPTLFTLTSSAEVCGASSGPQQDLCNLASDLIGVFAEWRFWGAASSLAQQEAPAVYSAGPPSSFTVTVRPCSSCNEPPEGQDTEASPTQFMTVGVELQDHQQMIGLQTAPNTTDVFTGLLSLIPAYFAPEAPLSALDAVFQNTFQSYYNIMRMELGVIFENQIYADPEIYNMSIVDIYVPTPDLTSSYRAANDSRRANASVLAEWRGTVNTFKHSDRVPLMLYLRPIPRSKPQGSAITSVFVSTFAMVSILWTTFNVVAGAIAGSSADKAPVPTALPDPEAGIRPESRHSERPDFLPEHRPSDTSSVVSEGEFKAQFLMLNGPTEDSVRMSGLLAEGLLVDIDEEV